MENIELSDKEFFDGLIVVIDNKPVKMNTIGVLRHNDKEYIAVTDMPEAEIAEDEYRILELVKMDGNTEGYQIKDITNLKERDEVYQLWEESVDEMEDED